MKSRCYNKNNRAYSKYGGRGIIICDEWLSFEMFHSWAILNGYTDKLSIDRIDVNGIYCPDNCKWSNSKEQASNRTNTKFYEVDGTHYTLKQLSEKFNVSDKTILKRLKSGKSVKQSISNQNYRLKLTIN